MLWRTSWWYRRPRRWAGLRHPGSRCTGTEPLRKYHPEVGDIIITILFLILNHVKCKMKISWIMDRSLYFIFLMVVCHKAHWHCTTAHFMVLSSINNSWLGKHILTEDPWTPDQCNSSAGWRVRLCQMCHGPQILLMMMATIRRKKWKVTKPLIYSQGDTLRWRGTFPFKRG